jgi:hypothetical protein
MNLLDVDVLFMRTETYQHQIFAYDAITDEFVCQGADMEELNQRFGLRYPTRKGILVQLEKDSS